MRKKIIIVVGPTASGKSDLALRLAKKMGLPGSHAKRVLPGGYLISADSRMVYRGMDIGTNKDQGVSRRVGGQKVLFVDGIPEYLVDVVAPDEEFTLDDWLKRTTAIIDKKKAIPIIVGGTGLYTTAISEGYHLPGGYNMTLRNELEELVKVGKIAQIIKKLKKIDKDIEQKIDIANSRRVVRAAQICFSTGQPLALTKEPGDYEILEIGLSVDREKLYQKINKRVLGQIKAGLVEEVKKLLKKYRPDSSAMTGIGYRQTVQYLEGEVTLERAIELIQRDTRRYAKRQMTWYRRDKNIHWIASYKEAEKLVRKFTDK